MEEQTNHFQGTNTEKREVNFLRERRDAPCQWLLFLSIFKVSLLWESEAGIWSYLHIHLELQIPPNHPVLIRGSRFKVEKK